MKLATHDVLMSGFGKAAMSGLSLVVLGAGVGAAVLVHAWWALVGAALAYAATFAFQLARPGLWREVLRELHCRPVELPPQITFSDEVARRFAGRLERARSERIRALENFVAPGAEPPRWMETALALERRAVALTNLLERLGRYLKREELASLRLDAHELRCQIGDEAPSGLLINRRWALEMCDGRIHTVTLLHGARDRVLANAEAATRTLESLPCRIVERALADSGMLDSAADHDLRADLLTDLGPTLEA
jgi:hypothetical protein